MPHHVCPRCQRVNPADAVYCYFDGMVLRAHPGGPLPVPKDIGPRLDLHPRRLVLGKLKPGDSKQLRLQVQNTGKGLLQGKLTIAEGASWLWVESDRGAGNSPRTCALKTAREQVVTLRVDT